MTFEEWWATWEKYCYPSDVEDLAGKAWHASRAELLDVIEEFLKVEVEPKDPDGWRVFSTFSGRWPLIDVLVSAGRWERVDEPEQFRMLARPVRREE